MYDDIEGFNIAMRAKSEQDACIEAILHYQERLVEARAKYKALNDKVESFFAMFDRED